MLGEVQNIAHRGRAKSIDRLGIVAHSGQPLALGRKVIKNVGLERVSILILIDQHAIEQSPNRFAGLGIGQQRVPENQQIIVVENTSRLLAVYIAVEKLLQFGLPIPTPRKMLLQNLVKLLPSVDASAVNRHAGSLLRESLVGLGQIQVGAHYVEQILGIRAIVNRELGRQTDYLAVTMQQSRGHGVIGSAPNARRVGQTQPAQQAFGPAKHFRGRPTGKR